MWGKVVNVGTEAFARPFRAQLETPFAAATLLFLLGFPRELSGSHLRISTQEDVMRAYLQKLPPKARLLLALPVLALAYPVLTMLLPAMLRAAVPNVVRSVLSLL
jgi:hypothetical protein